MWVAFHVALSFMWLSAKAWAWRVRHLRVERGLRCEIKRRLLPLPGLHAHLLPARGAYSSLNPTFFICRMLGTNASLGWRHCQAKWSAELSAQCSAHSKCSGNTSLIHCSEGLLSTPCQDPEKLCSEV